MIARKYFCVECNGDVLRRVDIGIIQNPTRSAHAYEEFEAISAIENSNEETASELATAK